MGTILTTVLAGAALLGVAAAAEPVAGLAPGEGVRHFAMTESPDGRSRLFTEQTPAGMRLMEMRKGADGEWSAPAPASFTDPTFFDADPFFDPRDGSLLFMSQRPHSGREPERRDFDLWRAERMGDAWGVPAPLGGGINTPEQEIFPSVDRNGVIYFASSRPGGAGGNDLYRAVPDGEGWRMENLAALNTAASDSNPAISADGRTLIFFSAGWAGAGDVDLFVSRLGREGWGAPRNLGPAVNTAAGEFAPGFSADGRTLFFSREAVLMQAPLKPLLKAARRASPAAPPAGPAPAP